MGFILGTPLWHDNGQLPRRLQRSKAGSVRNRATTAIAHRFLAAGFFGRTGPRLDGRSSIME